MPTRRSAQGGARRHPASVSSRAARSSPLVPYFFGLSGNLAALIAAILVGLALLGTGSIVGLLSGGASPWRRALRQLLIGFGAAAVTYLLGLLLGTGLG